MKVNGSYEELTAKMDRCLRTASDSTLADYDKNQLSTIEQYLVSALIRYSDNKPCPVYEDESWSEVHNAQAVFMDGTFSIPITPDITNFFKDLLSEIGIRALLEVMLSNNSQSPEQYIISAFMMYIKGLVTGCHKLSKDERYVYMLSVSYRVDKQNKTFTFDDLKNYNKELLNTHSSLTNCEEAKELDDAKLKQVIDSLHKHRIIQGDLYYSHVF